MTDPLWEALRRQHLEETHRASGSCPGWTCPTAQVLAALTQPAAPAEGLREAIRILRADLKETDREPTGTVARGASPCGLPEHGVSDVPSGSRPPRPPSPPKDREWDGS